MGLRYMPRPRLSDKMLNSGFFRLALISAPAGSGKTTMLSEWYLALQDRQVSTAWLSLDSYDNEPRRFAGPIRCVARPVLPGGARTAILPGRRGWRG